jgi:hypothetical protein
MWHDLLLKRGGRRGAENYDVIAEGTVVGRIMTFADTPGGRPWMWTLRLPIRRQNAQPRLRGDPRGSHAGVCQELAQRMNEHAERARVQTGKVHA